MGTTPLDPDEALAGPLYLVAALLVVIPLVDFLLSVASPELASVQWRFAAVGLLSGFTLTPLLGVALALGVAAIRQQVMVQRIVVALCLVTSVVLLLLSVGFVLDVVQLRATVPMDGRPAFQSAWTRALIKHVLTAAAFGYLGLRARKMIPGGQRSKTPRTVHVVSK